MLNLEYRAAPLEFRETGNGLGTVAGTVIRYGDVATLPFGTEEVAPGAFGNLESADLIANRMHNRDQPLARTGYGLSYENDQESLRGSVALPDTSNGRDTAAEVRGGLLQGLSIEFRTIKDELTDRPNGLSHRKILEARLYGWGVVDKPAYPQSVAAMRSWDEYRSAHGLAIVEDEDAAKRQSAAERSTIIAGPAGAGKTQRAQEIIQELRNNGLNPVAADFQSIYAALLLIQRQSDGRFPERDPDYAYMLAMVEYVRSVIINRALRNEQPVVATVSEGPGGERYAALLALFNGAAREETIDPGVREVMERLSERNGDISDQCLEAMRRWYGNEEITEELIRRGTERLVQRMPERRRMLV